MNEHLNGALATRSVTVHVPAKINLQLTAGGRTPDGYHELANVFLAVSVYEEVTIAPADRLRLTVSGPGADLVPTDETNLAAQAAILLAKRGGVEPNIHIDIAKRVPVAGGMAGGSADAAGVLVGCEALWNLGVDRGELVSLAAELGSDVPFSLLGGAALGLGRGERLSPLACGGSYHWALAVAGSGLSTPAVYRALDQRRRARGHPWAAEFIPPPQPDARLLDALARGDTMALSALLDNDLETVAISLRPQLAATFATGRASGALASVLCGTGATIAFLAQDARQAEHIADRLLAAGVCESVLVAHGPVAGPTADPLSGAAAGA